MQAMAVYNQLSKNNDVFSSRIEKSAEYFSDEEDELKKIKPKSANHSDFDKVIN